MVQPLRNILNSLRHLNSSLQLFAAVRERVVFYDFHMELYGRQQRQAEVKKKVLSKRVNNHNS